MTRSRRVSIAFLALSLAATLTPARPSPDAVEARIGRVENGLLPPVPVEGDRGMNILARMKSSGVPGVSVAVLSGGRIEWAKGYGVMDVDTKTPVTDRTLFVAGSISKPVAALGALLAVNDGKIGLDADINLALTSWKLPDNEFTRDRKVTLRDLLSHSGGTTVHGFGGYVAGSPVPTLRQILDGEAPANSPAIRVDVKPGTRWRYSGGGTTIVQQALIDVEGKPFPEILRGRVLVPAGMADSDYEQALTPERLARAASGHNRGRVIPGKRNVYPEMAAAGLWTTPADLCRYASAIQRARRGEPGAIAPKEIARLMTTPHIKIDDSQDMALGFFLSHGGTYFGHGGGDAGFVCQLEASVDGDFAAAVMTNSDTGAGPLISEILDAVAREYGWDGWAAAPVKLVKVVPPVLQKYAGRYRADAESALSVDFRDGALIGRRPGQRFELLPVSPSEFIRRDRNNRYVFEEGAVTITNGPASIRAERIPPEVRLPLDELLEGRPDEGARLYRAIYDRDPKDPLVDEARLNRLGYDLMSGGMMNAAIAVLRLNAELRPGSWNAHDSLGEALAAKGDRAGAIRSYAESVRLNPGNANGARRLEELSKAGKS